MKNNVRSRIYRVGLFFIFIVIILSPYCLYFNEYGIAKDTATWSEYGSYISGISSLLNLMVFIILTIYVARLGNQNNKKQIQIQKSIMISQFRQSTLDKLDEKLDQLFVINGIENKEITLARYSNTAVYLTTFSNQKMYLFPILNTDDIKRLVDNILTKIDELMRFMNQYYGKVQVDNPLFLKMDEKVQETSFLKNELIEKLQLFILDDLGE